VTWMITSISLFGIWGEDAELFFLLLIWMSTSSILIFDIVIGPRVPLCFLLVLCAFCVLGLCKCGL